MWPCMHRHTLANRYLHNMLHETDSAELLLLLLLLLPVQPC